MKKKNKRKNTENEGRDEIIARLTQENISLKAKNTVYAQRMKEVITELENLKSEYKKIIDVTKILFADMKGAAEYLRDSL